MKLSIQLGILSASNIGLSFLFQWYVLTQFGPGWETDALFAGMTVPQLVLAVIGGSLMHVLVPLLAGEGEERLRRDAWGFFVLIAGLFGLLAVILYVAAPWWVPLTVPGFSDAGKTLTIMLTRIQLVGMVFTAVNGVQWAAYHARQRFLWAEFAPLLTSVFAILLLIWALPVFGIVAAAWISTLRMGLQTLLLAPVMGRPSSPELRSPTVLQAWQRIKPLLLGTTYYKTDPLVDRFLLSTARSGNLSLYFLAQQIYAAIMQILNKAVAAPLVPLLSMYNKSGDKASFKRLYYRRIIQVCTLCLGVLLIFALFGQALLGLLVGYGNVSAENVTDLWWVMVWLGGMFVGGVVGQIASLTFYSVGDTTTPTRMSMLSYTVYIPSKVVSFYCWGIAGLAITTSVYYIINLSLLIYLLNEKSVL